MKRIALLGAGFSRNWGGWLAIEAFEYLIGAPEVLADPGLPKLLWRYQATGGFEDALAELQQGLRQTPQPGVEIPMGSNVPLLSQAMALQSAIGRMFDEMNTAYNSLPEFDARLAAFLANFDAIFTLNQDMLLERLYVGQLPHMRAQGFNWAGSILPGMRQVEKVRHSNGVEFWSEYIWAPDPAAEFPQQLAADHQPIYKLHGSSQWRGEVIGGSPILIIGGDKSRQIAQFPILERYAEAFDSWLCQETRLMVIGYGFLDPHINEALLRAGSKGLQLFIVDPNGPAAVRNDRNLQALLRQTLIGASRRPIRETVASDPTERRKLARFLEV